jgi:hypothetical protein
MSKKSADPGPREPESQFREVDGVPVYTRPEGSGRPGQLDAIGQDETKIRDIADRLQRRGFGVLRQRNPRAGKVFYTLKAAWAGPGDPPADPFGDD